jgi:hypothetical protein
VDVLAAVLLLALIRSVGGAVIDAQNNPVPSGAIVVAAGETDRSDWEGIPWFVEDIEDQLAPVDIHRVQIAHDATHVYLHLEANLWEVDEAWRVGTFIDIDQDPTTGFNGGFPFPIGAEYLNEGGDLFAFTGAAPNEWSWILTTGGMARDQTSLTDVELAIPREALEDPEAFDFLMLANNEFEIGAPLDFYPEAANFQDGDFFTYELGAVPLTGDFDLSGGLDAADIDLLSADVRAGTNTARFDLSGDGVVTQEDRRVWVEQTKRTYFGDANLDGQFGSSDFVDVFQSGEYEDAISGNSSWATGDWNGDGDFTSGDFVVAFQAGGYELGPRGAAAAVPEPCGWMLALLGVPSAMRAGTDVGRSRTRRRVP